MDRFKRRGLRKSSNYSACALNFTTEPTKTKAAKKTKMLDGSEKSMLPILLANKHLIIEKSSNVVSREEFSAGSGIADVVFFSINQELLTRRLNHEHPALTDYRLLSTYLAIAEYEEVNHFQLRENLGFPGSSFESYIFPELIQSGLIEMKSDTVSVSQKIENPVNRCVAIEAKVKDWRSGLKQAVRYKEFADQTYLAIYEKHSKVPISHIDLFEKLGVGLILVSNEGIQIAAAASSSGGRHINRMLASERLVSSLDNFSQPFMPREPFATSRA